MSLWDQHQPDTCTQQMPHLNDQLMIDTGQKNRYILQTKTFWPGSGIIYHGSCDQMVFSVYENISQFKNVFYSQ